MKVLKNGIFRSAEVNCLLRLSAICSFNFLFLHHQLCVLMLLNSLHALHHYLSPNFVLPFLHFPLLKLHCWPKFMWHFWSCHIDECFKLRKFSAFYSISKNCPSRLRCTRKKADQLISSYSLNFTVTYQWTICVVDNFEWKTCNYFCK